MLANVAFDLIAQLVREVRYQEGPVGSSVNDSSITHQLCRDGAKQALAQTVLYLEVLEPPGTDKLEQRVQQALVFLMVHLAYALKLPNVPTHQPDKREEWIRWGHEVCDEPCP